MATTSTKKKSKPAKAPAEDSSAFGPIAERFRRAGDLERAVSLCREGLQKYPDHVSARVTLGWALLELSRYDEARTELELVLRRRPDNLAAIRALAELHDRAEHTLNLPMDGPGQWPPSEDAVDAATAEPPAEAVAASSVSEPDAEPELIVSGHDIASKSAGHEPAVMPPAEIGLAMWSAAPEPEVQAEAAVESAAHEPLSADEFVAPFQTQPEMAGVASDPDITALLEEAESLEAAADASKAEVASSAEVLLESDVDLAALAAETAAAAKAEAEAAADAAAAQAEIEAAAAAAAAAEAELEAAAAAEAAARAQAEMEAAARAEAEAAAAEAAAQAERERLAAAEAAAQAERERLAAEEAAAQAERERLAAEEAAAQAERERLAAAEAAAQAERERLAAEEAAAQAERERLAAAEAAAAQAERDAAAAQAELEAAAAAAAAAAAQAEIEAAAAAAAIAAAQAELEAAAAAEAAALAEAEAEAKAFKLVAPTLEDFPEPVAEIEDLVAAISVDRKVQPELNWEYTEVAEVSVVAEVAKPPAIAAAAPVISIVRPTTAIKPSPVPALERFLGKVQARRRQIVAESVA